MTTTVDAPGAIHTAERVAATFDEIFATVTGWHDTVLARLASPADRTAAALDPVVEAIAVPAVTAGGLVTGAGFVAAPGLLSDAAWHLAWWLADRAGGARRLATVDDPADDQFRDYTALEWWRVPAQTRTRHLTGPYVDYLCTDDYTVTVTMPLHLDDELLGMVGADVLVDGVERRLLPALRAHDAPVAIVNASGRVVTATGTRHEPGSLLRLDGLSDALAALRHPGSPTVDVRLPGGARVLSCGDAALGLVLGF